MIYTYKLSRCLDQIQLLPHLKDAAVSDDVQIDETICSRNATKFIASKLKFKTFHSNGSYNNYKPIMKDVQLHKQNNHSNNAINELKSQGTNQTNLSTIGLLTEIPLNSNGQMAWLPLLDNNNITSPLHYHRRSTVNRKHFYSSANIFAIRLIYGKIEKIENASNFHFYINGNFRFLNKCK